MKGQVLADFVAKFSSIKGGGGKETICNIEVILWKVLVDGASNASEVEVVVIVITVEGIKLEHSFRLGLKASNNEAEYEALMA